MRMKQYALASAALIAAFWAFSMGVSSALAVGPADGPGPYDNYFVGPACPCPSGLGATLYPCPRPVPPRVGITWIPYEPLAPHEFMYKHRTCYRTVHEDCTVTRTHVSYR